MREIPIIFSTPMVQAIRRDVDPKTQTRRVVKDTGFYAIDAAVHGAETAARELAALATRCPYGQPGDHLWVKETFHAWGRWETRYSDKKKRDEWHFVDLTLEAGKQYRYAADMGDNGSPARCAGAVRWWKRPAIFMPRQASRLTLENTLVRVDKLQDISEADAIAEGVDFKDFNSAVSSDETHRSAYARLWDFINGAGSWAANPFVWCVSFRRLEA